MMIRRRLGQAAGVIGVLLMALVAMFYARYGGHGRPFPNLSTTPLMAADRVQIVATLDQPPGNMAVSPTGRIFFTYHAESRPDFKVLELVNGKPVPYPNVEMQHPKSNHSPGFDQVFSLRVDRQNRLWTLDHGFHGLRQPRLLAFDLSTNQVVHQWDIPRDVAGAGSYVQDFQVDPDGHTIYISDLSVMAEKPAVIVYDVDHHTARRVLERHPSLMPQDYEINSKGRRMYLLFGLYWLHPGFDPIALDRHNEWLYVGPMSGDTLYRVRVSDLRNASLGPADLASRVESYARKSQCDGLSIDNRDNIYVTSIEDGAINIIRPDRKQQTLVKSPLMRWPDGLSFGPDRCLYVADSDLPDVMMQSSSHIAASAPFYIFKIPVGEDAPAGQ